MLLALDTSTNTASIALIREERLVGELTWDVGQRHSAELLQRLDWLLETVGAKPVELTEIAVATGPGSFNGVRVALTVAKSLCFALGARLAACSTLDVAGWGYASAGDPVWALLDAGRGEVYAAEYPSPSTDAAAWSPVDGYLVLTPQDLAQRIAGRALFCGEWRAETETILREALGARARFASRPSTRRAVWLAELAIARLHDGRVENPATIEPLYLRKPAITISKKAGIPLQDPHQPSIQAEATASQEQPAGSEDAPHALRR
ncbi:MAG TPA: tRNA (adenosine(37)-N6)-threonylcarbamoyltransferase complex dimerization subunit type 1 TsaB [Ktedonobacterales bacterium]